MRMTEAVIMVVCCRKGVRPGRGLYPPASEWEADCVDGLRDRRCHPPHQPRSVGYRRAATLRDAVPVPAREDEPSVLDVHLCP